MAAASRPAPRRAQGPPGPLLRGGERVRILSAHVTRRARSAGLLLAAFPPRCPARPPQALRAGPAAGRGTQARLAAGRAAAGEEEEPPAGRAPSAGPGAGEGSGISRRCLEGETAGEGAASGARAPPCVVGPPAPGSRSGPCFLRGGGAAGLPFPEASLGAGSAAARQAALRVGKAPLRPGTGRRGGPRGRDRLS